MDANSLSHIENLNQRGGRMLSIINLLEAGTLNFEIASLLLFLMSKNSSFLSCAGPGGAGKTALMGSLLIHLPENTGIFLYEEGCAVRVNSCVLAHEINRAAYSGYIWGKEARRFFSLPSREKNISICATAHADSPRELAEILVNDHGVREPDVYNLDFLVFINFTRVGRKLISLEQGTDGGFRTLYRYKRENGGWEKVNGFDFSRFGVSGEEFKIASERAAEILRMLDRENAREIASVARLL